MASEVEDCSSFEADCLPTGSVSFGRFESESLTWERRSSFSHNRYLEEVEKYSTPGSVIKKKAYFEAHFKKTALRNLESIERQNDIDGQSENDVEDQVNCVKDFRDHGNGELQFEDFEDHEKFGVQFSWYDETPDVSDEEQLGIMEIEKKKEASSSELPVESTNGNDGSHEQVSKSDFQIELCGETMKTPSVSDTSELISNAGLATADKKSENEVENLNSKKLDASAKSSAATKVHASSLKKESKSLVMAKTTVEQKSRKIKSGMEAPAAQIKRKISTSNIHPSTRMSSAKISNKIDKGPPVRLKQSSKISPSCSGPQHMKSEDSGRMKVKGRAESRSSFNTDKGDNNTKSALVRPYVSHQPDQIDGRKSTNRDKRITRTMKLGTGMDGVVFSFKSDERAEKRKEFYMKLEEKQHTKEVELNEIHAKKQEETEAELKQLRKSLNFKATPMPSFYHDAGPKISDGKKAINGPVKSSKLHGKSANPGNRGVTRANSPSLSKSSNPQGPSIPSEHPSTTQQEFLMKSEGHYSCAIATNGAGKAGTAGASKHASEPEKKVDAVKREDRTRPNLQQQQGASKVKKRDGVHNVRRNSMGKVIKGVATGGMVVRVAS